MFTWRFFHSQNSIFCLCSVFIKICKSSAKTSSKHCLYPPSTKEKHTNSNRQKNSADVIELSQNETFFLSINIFATQIHIRNFFGIFFLNIHEKSGKKTRINFLSFAGASIYLLFICKIFHARYHNTPGKAEGKKTCFWFFSQFLSLFFLPKWCSDFVLFDSSFFSRSMVLCRTNNRLAVGTIAQSRMKNGFP